MKPSLQIAHFGVRKTWDEAMADLETMACYTGRVIALYPTQVITDTKLPDPIGWLAVPDSHRCFACGQPVPPVDPDAS